MYVLQVPTYLLKRKLLLLCHVVLAFAHATCCCHLLRVVLSMICVLQVPTYLLERKLQMAQEYEARLAAKAAAAIPPGLRQMPETERQETLALLQQNRQEVEAKLSALPIIIETHSMVRVLGPTAWRHSLCAHNDMPSAGCMCQCMSPATLATFHRSIARSHRVAGVYMCTLQPTPCIISCSCVQERGQESHVIRHHQQYVCLLCCCSCCCCCSLWPCHCVRHPNRSVTRRILRGGWLRSRRHAASSAGHTCLCRPSDADTDVSMQRLCDNGGLVVT